MPPKLLPLLLTVAALAACGRAPAAPAATRAPNGTAAALEQRLQALPPTVRVHAGDRIDPAQTFIVEMPDGAAPTVDLPSLLRAQGKRAALFWFYQMDNTSW
jgi:hypothetical protein